MKSPLLELQAALFTMLSNGLTAAPVYDHVPDDEKFPVVTVGEVSATNSSPKVESLWEVSAAIHCFSRYHGSKQIKSLIDEVVSLLSSQSLSLTGFNVVLSRFETVTIIRESEIIRHAIVRWRYLIQEESNG